MLLSGKTVSSKKTSASESFEYSNLSQTTKTMIVQGSVSVKRGERGRIAPEVAPYGTCRASDFFLNRVPFRSTRAMTGVLHRMRR